MQKKRKRLFRGGFYTLGLLFLAFGITLNTKTQLGVSPIISVPNSIAVLAHAPLAAVILGYYILLVIAQFLLRPKNFCRKDVLQAPVSVIFSTLIGAFDAHLDFSAAGIALRLGLLLLAVACTGIGVTLTVAMDLVPNSADGLVATIAARTGRNMGLTKNIFDLASVGVTAVLSLLLGGRIIGVGLGTLVTVLGTGRVIAFCNAMFRGKTRTLAGLQREVAQDPL